MAVEYEVVHVTEYDYSQSVSVSHHVTHLCPRNLPSQERRLHELHIEPEPAVTSAYEDYFGNAVTFFAMQGAHKRLTVRGRSEVAVMPASWPTPTETPPWEAATDPSALPLEAVEFTFDSPLIRASAELATYTRPSFRAGRPLLEAVTDLTRRIHEDFTYDPKATTVATPLGEVFNSRRGVCQDFAHLEIGCLRSLGLAAQYVSGYLATVRPEGAPRLLGADVSHAWLSVFCPEFGWIHVDPTNNLLPIDTHVTLARGRDYGDVSPIHGVILGGGNHSLRVSVDVIRLEAPSQPANGPGGRPHS
jgi:transglutaminase-like putative cysteine protease